MADYRFGSVETGSDHRFGSVLYSFLGARDVGSGADHGAPGDSVAVPLSGTWDASGKVAWLLDASSNAVSLTVGPQDATSITVTVPTPYADGSSFSAFNLDVAYTLRVDDTGAPVDRAQDFTIDAPAQPTYWYIASITGSPWGADSIFYGAQNLSDGDSAIIETVSGGPFVSVNSDGTWTAADTIRFRVKAFNADGWSSSWADWYVEALNFAIVEDFGAGSGGSRRKSMFDEQDEQIRSDDKLILETVRWFIQEKA